MTMKKGITSPRCKTLPHTVTRGNTLQHTELVATLWIDTLVWLGTNSIVSVRVCVCVREEFPWCVSVYSYSYVYIHTCIHTYFSPWMVWSCVYVCVCMCIMHVVCVFCARMHVCVFVWCVCARSPASTHFSTRLRVPIRACAHMAVVTCTWCVLVFANTQNILHNPPLSTFLSPPPPAPALSLYRHCSSYLFHSLSSPPSSLA